MHEADITRFLSEPCLSQTVFMYTMTRKKPSKAEFCQLLNTHRELAVQHRLIGTDTGVDAAWAAFNECGLVKKYLK